MQWSELTIQIKNCHQCPGLNDNALGTDNAPGYGNSASPIMIVGQSLCGKKCIESQIPFSGGSGQLLDKAFEAAGISKADIFITNVVKCHPPNNRPSTQIEIDNCALYLATEISWLKPKIVIPLGKDAWQVFGADASTTHLDKKLDGDRAIHYFYHPSYLMRKSKADKEVYISDMAALIKSGLL